MEANVILCYDNCQIRKHFTEAAKSHKWYSGECSYGELSVSGLLDLSVTFDPFDHIVWIDI